MIGWFIAGFDGPCDWGDWVEPGDTVRFVQDPGPIDLPIGWEHKDCHEAEGPVRPVRSWKEGKDS
jgi:hypothetical protein